MVIDIAGLRDYWRALAARTAAIVQELRPENLDEAVDADYAQQVAAEDDMFSPGGSWVVQVLENKPRGVTRTLLGFRGRCAHACRRAARLG
jgi:hypothetical protein